MTYSMTDDEKAGIALTAIIDILKGTLDNQGKLRAIERVVSGDKKEFF